MGGIRGTSRGIKFDYVLCIQFRNARGNLYCQGGLRQGQPPYNLHGAEEPMQSWTNRAVKDKRPHNISRPSNIATLFPSAYVLNET